MIKSMTGYGRARQELHKRDITVEVRSVNNRYLDCTVKMPRMYSFAEDAVKQCVQKAISRGKVDVFVTIDASAADVSVVTVNEPLARGYFQALTQLKSMFSLEGDVTPMTLAKLPDVLTVTKAEEDLETVAADICQVLDKALAAYNTMRTVEGRRLAEDIAGRLVTIETAVGRVEQQSYRACMGLLKLAERKSSQQLENACAKALQYSNSPSYKSIKNLLAATKDAPDIGSESSQVEKPHGITRGAKYYGGKQS